MLKVFTQSQYLKKLVSFISAKNYNIFLRQSIIYSYNNGLKSFPTSLTIDEAKEMDKKHDFLYMDNYI